MLALLPGLTAGMALAAQAAVSGMVVPEDAAAEKGEAATKWTTLILLVAALLVALGAGPALVKAFDGTNGPDDIAGTKKADKTDCRAGNDS